MLFVDALNAEFSQVKVMGPRVGRNKAAIEGACHNFSLSWIADIIDNPSGGAKDRMATLGKNAGGANPLLQKVFGDRWSREGCEGADTLMLQIHGLSTVNVFPYKKYSTREVKRALTGNVGFGLLYSFWFRGGVMGAEGGAHSVAFYPTKHGGKVAIHFFDPNFGEFLFTEDEFRQFWTTLVRQYGPMKDHWMRQCRPGKKLVLGGR